jgi:hypothetical protein
MPSVADKVETNSQEIQEITIVNSSPLSTPPPPPRLPDIDFVIIFVANGKEMGERGIVINVNQDFESFESELNRLVNEELPNDLTLAPWGPTVIYK